MSSYSLLHPNFHNKPFNYPISQHNNLCITHYVIVNNHLFLLRSPIKRSCMYLTHIYCLLRWYIFISPHVIDYLEFRCCFFCIPNEIPLSLARAIPSFYLILRMEFSVFAIYSNILKLVSACYTEFSFSFLLWDNPRL